MHFHRFHNPQAVTLKRQPNRARQRNAVQPQVALIQSGWRNRFGHPAAAVVQRLTAAQAQIFNTAQCGAIDWQSSRPDQAQCERQRQPRYWQTLPHPTPTALAPNTTGPE
mgnify:CR=1 FL=1